MLEMESRPYEPLVSVLIPAYNHEDYIEKCLNSVLDETYSNIELIIINDGSIDRTGEKINIWIEKHKNVFPIMYISRENRGLTATLNELASKANGEFFRLGASDDYFLPGGIQAQVNYLRTNQKKLAVIGDFTVVNEKDETLFNSGMLDMHRVNKRGYFTDEGIKKEVISHWAVSGPTPMIRKTTHQILQGWDETLKIDDWDFFLRLVARNGLGFVDAKVCAYRIHQSNTCRTKDRLKRIANLRDMVCVARQNVGLFYEPYCTLLKAQSYLTLAKIGFLKRNVFDILKCMPIFWWLTAYARLISIIESRNEDAEK